MDNNISQKLLISLPLANALRIVVTCPCENVPACHMREFSASIGLGFAAACYFSLINAKQ